MKKAILIGSGILSVVLLILPLLWCCGLWYYQPVSLLPTLLFLAAVVLWWRKKGRVSLHLILWLMVIVNIITYQCIPSPTPEIGRAHV